MCEHGRQPKVISGFASCCESIDLYSQRLTNSLRFLAVIYDLFHHFEAAQFYLQAKVAS